MINYITAITIRNVANVGSRMLEFYTNAKNFKYPHSYGYDEVVQDARRAFSVMHLTPSESTKEEWLNMGYDTAVNDREWGFAYTLKEVGRNDFQIFCIMTIHDADKSQNLKVSYDNRNRFILELARKPKASWYMGHKITAHKMKDGHIHLFKNKREIPNCVFDKIIENFKTRENGEIYAIVEYKGRRYKIVSNVTNPQMLELESLIRRIARRIISEMRRRYGRKKLVG